MSQAKQQLMRLVGWSLTALSMQFRSYRVFKVELYYKYKDLMRINSSGKIIEKEKYNSNSNST